MYECRGGHGWPRAATYDVHGRDCSYNPSAISSVSTIAPALFYLPTSVSVAWRSDVLVPQSTRKCGSGLCSPFRRCAILLRSKARACLPSFRFPAPLGSPGQTDRGLPVRRANRPLDYLQISGLPMASPLTGMKVHRTFILFRFAHGLRPSGRPSVVQICSRQICRSPLSSSRLRVQEKTRQHS